MAIFKGIIEEKKYHDYKFAQQYYNVGVRDMTSFGAYGNEYIVKTEYRPTRPPIKT